MQESLKRFAETFCRVLNPTVELLNNFETEKFVKIFRSLHESLKEHK